MEYGEAKKAVEACKMGKGSYEDAIHELGHLAAAAAQARLSLLRKQDKENEKNKDK